MDEQRSPDQDPSQHTNDAGPQSAPPPPDEGAVGAAAASGGSLLEKFDGAPGAAITAEPGEIQMGTVAHLLGLTTLVGIPGFVGPLVLWLIKKEQSAFINDQAKEALNFQISALILIIPVVLVCFVLAPFTCGISLFVPLAVSIVYILMMVRAALATGKGVSYRYRFAIRLIK